MLRQLPRNTDSTVVIDERRLIPSKIGSLQLVREVERRPQRELARHPDRAAIPEQLGRKECEIDVRLDGRRAI